MTIARTRYPGAQPFSDTDFSRRTFFGREQDSAALADQILANRLTVVYAKSGLGKTSLLNAGVSPRLREAGSMPLPVRVNDTKRGPLKSVLDGIAAADGRQQVEFVEGDRQSLWSFFKTVEFWRNDLLLTPVLVFDQFEELFTLQSEQAREEFLAELGYLVRGVPPPTLPAANSARRNAPPVVRVVLSLREDFLGILEEAANHIPQILDHRFRLTPLTCEAAAQAIAGPAAIDDPGLATRPFRLHPDLVTGILAYLSISTSSARASRSRYVEPFQLQLICQRIEHVAALRQSKSHEEIVVQMADLGGEAGFTQTLLNFYSNAIGSVPEKHLRPTVRRMCEQYLISPEGRRLSVEERELQRQLRLPVATLNTLVETRLLRTDRRSDSTYYELSHDALVQPVLAGRRTQALLVGWAGTLTGWLLSLVAAVLILAGAYFVLGPSQPADTRLGGSLFVGLGAALLYLGVRWLRGGSRMRRRYRRRAPHETTQPLPDLRPRRGRLLGWAAFVAGTIPAVMALLMAAIGVPLLLVYLFTGRFPAWQAEWFGLVHRRPLLEVPWFLVELMAYGVAGWLLLRQACRNLWPQEFASASSLLGPPGVDSPSRRARAFLKLAFGAGVFVCGGLLLLISGRCVLRSPAPLPAWLSGATKISDIAEACKNGWSLDAATLALFSFSAFVVSGVLLRDGVRRLRYRKA